MRLLAVVVIGTVVVIGIALIIEWRSWHGSKPDDG